MGLSARFASISASFNPEIPAAFCLVTAVRFIRRSDSTTRAHLLAGLCMAFLPWLHVNSSRLASWWRCGCCGNRAKPGRLAVFFIPQIFSAAGMLVFFRIAYGSCLPMPNTGHGVAPGEFALRGMLVYGLTGITGFWPTPPLRRPFCRRLVWLLRHRREAAWSLPLADFRFSCLPSHWMWWGGPCPPARFLIPLLPVLAPAWRWGLFTDYGKGIRLALWMAVGCSLALGLGSLAVPEVLSSHRHVLRDWDEAWNAYPGFPPCSIIKAWPCLASSS